MVQPKGYPISDGGELSLKMTRAIIQGLMNPNAECLVHGARIYIISDFFFCAFSYSKITCTFEAHKTT